MSHPDMIPLNEEQCSALLEAAQTMTDIARRASNTICKVDDPLQIETTIIGMCVATLIAQEAAYGTDAKRKPMGTGGHILEARLLGAGAGIGQIIGQLPGNVMLRVTEAVTHGISQGITKSMRFK